MPIVTAHIAPGYRPEQKLELLKNSSAAIESSLNAPLRSIRMVLQEHAADSTIVAGEVGANLLLYIVYLIEGRTVEQKSALIAALSQAAERSLGISNQDVRVVVCDIPKSDMGVAGGVSALAAGR